MIDERLEQKLLAMTWDGLREWSDTRSVTRGKEYVGRVETPAVFADGSVVSEVHGSDDYYTKLYVDADGDLRGECTCPVGICCKHTVALALVAAKMLKEGTAIAELLVKWFRVLTHDGQEISYSYGWSGDRNEKVAEAIAKIAPELALKVWQKKIAANCEKPDRSCYANIGLALRKMRPVMDRLGRSDEWQRILDGLRTEYKRRSSLVKILNDIDREKGGTGRIAD